MNPAEQDFETHTIFPEQLAETAAKERQCDQIVSAERVGPRAYWTDVAAGALVCLTIVTVAYIMVQGFVNLLQGLVRLTLG